jgi:hypothetical protein
MHERQSKLKSGGHALLLGILLVFVVSCGKSEPGSATPVPGVTAAEETTPEPTQSTGTETGLRDLDEIIDAALAPEPEKLFNYVALQSVACLNVSGMGGPPPCDLAPGGSAPDGTLLNVFPLSSCELQWVTDVVPRLKQIIATQPELYAVVEFTAQPFSEPFLPIASYGVILQTRGSDGSRLGRILHIQDGKVVYLGTVCVGPPELFLTSAPYAGKTKLILKGPAFR